MARKNGASGPRNSAAGEKSDMHRQSDLVGPIAKGNVALSGTISPEQVTVGRNKDLTFSRISPLDQRMTSDAGHGVQPDSDLPLPHAALPNYANFRQNAIR